MIKQRTRFISLALAFFLSATWSGAAFAETLIVGQSSQEVSVGGPGAAVSEAEQTSETAAEDSSQSAMPFIDPNAAVQTLSPWESGGGSSSQEQQDTGELPQLAPILGDGSLPTVIAQPAQNAVENAVAINADYGDNGEILRLSMNLNGIPGTITYGVYVNNGGFLPWQGDGGIAGGTEGSTHLEAIQIAITGEAGKVYDVWYRGTSANAGQHGWACNEELMGTIGRGDYLKNLEVVLVPKGLSAGDATGRFYSNHSEYIRISSEGSTYAGGYTGWADHDNARYYFVDGQAVTGWQYIDGLKYYFNESGAMVMDLRDMVGAQDSYIIKVNKELNCATIYAPDGENGYIIPIRAMLTSTGDDTPIGTFYTPEKYRWRFMINDTWTQYATRINGGVLFHSITYASPNEWDLITDGYNKLGVTRSHGCVRLTAENAKWVYENCKLGTAVVVYNDPSVPSPFFKPYQKWIPADQKWDPTDPACAGQQ